MLISILCCCLAAAVPSHTRAQELKRRDAAPVSRPPVILSHSHLTPPLHSRLRALQFSPDGKYILLQDEATAYVLTRSPLAIQLSLPANRALPIRFTADSKAIVIGLQDMRARKWHIESDEGDEAKKFTEGTECYYAAVSPHGTYYACLQTDSTLRVFRIDDGQLVFNGRVGEERDIHAPAIIPLHDGLARSEPFGYYMGALLSFRADRRLLARNLRFSPDEHYLLATAWRETMAIADLQTGKKIGVAGSFKHAIDHGDLEFVSDDRLAYVSEDKAEDSALLSFPKGDVVAKLNVTGGAQRTSDPRYMVHFATDGSDAELLDTQTGKPVSKILREGGDVFGDESASYAPDVGLAITPVGKDTVKTLALVPPTPLQTLRTAMASPNLQNLALGVSGDGGIFRVADGKQLLHFHGLRGAWFDDEQHCYVRGPRANPPGWEMDRIDLASGAKEKLWPNDDHLVEYLMSGPVVLSQHNTFAYFWLGSGGSALGYSLDVLDRNTGRPLWSRAAADANRGAPAPTMPPVPFDDPQGERIVLGWDGASDGAKKLAKGNAVMTEALKQTKAAAHDSLFEVLDARTGNRVGLVLVPGGSGPESYTSAFSAGDWLILVKDEMRVTAVSLSGGAERLKLTAYYPALYGPTGLLAVTQDGGHLALYDLKTGQQRDSYGFPSMVVYSRFSADGKRMLVLTQDQSVYVLDLTSAPPAAPGAPSLPTLP